MKKILLLCVTLILIPISALAVTIIVPSDQPTIQAAIDVAVDGDVVVIADGTYSGVGNYDIDFKGKAITVTSAGGPETCIIDCELQGRGFLFYSGETETSVLEGLTIKNGDAGTGNDGGGIYANGSAPYINNCIFADNTGGSGGAIYLHSLPADCTINECTFTGNESSSNGGGIYCYNSGASSSLTISEGTFSVNSANNDGGAVYASNVNAKLEGCSFNGNSAQGSWDSAGAVYVDRKSEFNNCSFTANHSNGYNGNCGAVYASSSLFDGCTFESNTASGSYGAVRADNSTFENCGFTNNSANAYGAAYAYNSTFDSCIFTDNSATVNGGALGIERNGSYTNCLFSGNSADNGGAAYLTNAEDVTFVNCTFFENQATTQGGALWCDIPFTPEDPIVIKNCIYWNNTAPDGAQIYEHQKAAYVVFSDVQGGHDGDGNIDEDPLFVDDANGDLHLFYGSPCIDVGDVYGSPDHDLDGSVRPAGNGYDIGAYEYQGPIFIDSLTADPDSGRPPLDVLFVCTTHDDDTTIVEYQWNFGDNNSTTSIPNSISHDYLTPGSYNATCTVIDDDGNQTEASVSVEIINDSPISNAGPDQGVLGTQVQLDGSGSYDPDGTISSWEWSLTHLNNPEFNKIASGETPLVDNLAAGLYQVTLLVTDNFGAGAADRMFLSVGEGYTYIIVPNDQPTIQAAIDAAVDGDVVVIGDGTYSGVGNYDIDFKGKAITVTSAGGPETCIVDCEQQGRGFLFYSGETETSVLEGLTIKNGDAGTGNNGGGVYANGSAPYINNCIFVDNIGGNGGAIYLYSMPTDCTIYECTFTGNESSTSGGGIYCYNFSTSSSLTISAGTFSGNSAYNDGGGAVYASNVNAKFEGCTFNGNSIQASWGGGGVVYVNRESEFMDCSFTANHSNSSCGAVYASSSLFDGCTFESNTASGSYGAVRADNSTFDSCVFTNNSAANGGALSINRQGWLANCLFTGNSAENGGAVHLADSDNVLFVNCTFFDNQATTQGGALWCDIPFTPEDPIVIKNCIFWNNTALDGAQIYENEKSVSIVYSDIQGGHDGEGNIDDNPLFVDASNGNLHLTLGSPCVDSGMFDGAPDHDLDNNLRPVGNEYDIGAYEFQGTIVIDSLTADPDRSLSGETISFACTAHDDTAVIIEFQWSFGDGAITSTPTGSVDHIYAGPGTFTVVCTVVNDRGEVRATTTKVIINSLEETIVIDSLFAYPVSGLPDQIIYFACTAHDDTAQIVEYQWSFGDGESLTSTTGQVQHIYATPGAYVVQCTVVNDRLETSTTEMEVIINEFEDTIVIDSLTADPDRGLPDLPVSFTCVAHDDTTTISEYQWSFGDGESLTTTDGNAQHIYIDSGLFTASCTVVNGRGETSTKTTLVMVNRLEPITIRIPTDFTTIQEAIDMALEGDTVLIADGIYFGKGNMNLDFRGKAITVRAENGPEECVIDCQQQGRAFIFNHNETKLAAVDGLTIRNGSMIYLPMVSTCGGGIYVIDSYPSILNCRFEDNLSLERGGAIYIDNSSESGREMTIQGCEFENNKANSDGGGVFIKSTSSVVISSCVFINNSTYSDGGAICTGSYSTGLLDLESCVFSDNIATKGGGAISLNYCESRISDCTFAQNTAWSRNGGAIFIDSTRSVTLASVVFTGNTSNASGGAIYRTGTNEGSWSLNSCSFMDNIAKDDGGAVFLNSRYQIVGNSSIENCSFEENIAWDGSGGAIFSTDNSLLVSGSTFTRNSANSSREGGAIYSGDVHLLNSTFSTNHAGNGGAVFSYGINCENCFFKAGNKAHADGGAIYTTGSNRSDLTNVIFTDNSAVRGGAIFTSALGDLQINSCSIVGNHAVEDGAAIWCYLDYLSEFQLLIMNSILWDNVSPTSNHLFAYGRHPEVLFSDIEGGYEGVGIIDSNPAFLRVDTTSDLYLQYDSPCIDNGTSENAPDEDIEGFLRPVGLGYDIGAREFLFDSFIWEGSNNSWSDGDNWNYGMVPDKTTKVIISSKNATEPEAVVDIDDAAAQKITIESGGLTVGPGVLIVGGQ